MCDPRAAESRPYRPPQAPHFSRPPVAVIDARRQPSPVPIFPHACICMQRASRRRRSDRGIADQQHARFDD
jgi:hypothetical protein